MAAGKLRNLHDRTSETKRVIRLAVATAAVVFATVGPVQAGLIFSFSGGSKTSGQNSTYGFDFTPVQDITVDSLGFFDLDQDGLVSSHRVGIWNLGGTLLESTTVTTANSVLSGPVINDGQYRFTPITGLNLSSGTTYRFGASIEGASDAWYVVGTNISESPSLASVSSTGFFKGASFAFPDQTVGNTYAAGSFTATATNAVPEPHSLAIFGIGVGLMAIGAARRRRQAKTSVAACQLER